MDLEQLERFALGDDREAALAELVPGTEDYYHYHCLHYQHTGRLRDSYELIERWLARHGRSERWRRASHRQALLSWEHDPQGCVDYLSQALALSFDHARELEAARQALPTALDEALISRPQLRARALLEHADLSGFTDAALDWLVTETLEPTRRRALIERLDRPDHAGLVDVILADLAEPRSQGFGSASIHRLLLTEQLDELARRRPALLGEQVFVQVYLGRLAPGVDDDPERDPAVRRAHLDRLWAFVSELAPSFNALKAHVLYHRLDFDRGQGERDRDRFLAYLALPRQVSYAPTGFLERHRGRVAGLNLRFPTGLPAVGDDQPLVLDYLAHYLADADDTSAFEPYVRDDLLRQVLATTKLLAGDPDGERWYALLDDPGFYQALRERVDIELAPENPRFVGVHEPVVIDVEVKNVPTLVVKIYELDTLGYYLSEDREIDSSIDLDGLPASRELVVEYEEPPIRRVRRQFRFDDLDRPGVYVIDFIGAGQSSRALIRKGQLGYVERAGAAGQVLTVIDERGRVVPEASVWLGDREYPARDDGTILIPYSTRPGRRTLLLRSGELCVRERFHHYGERYRFSAGFYLDRESLIPGHAAQVVIRPALTVNDTSVSLSLLSSARLSITTTDRQGVSASKEVSELSVAEDGEIEVSFQVPEALAEVELALEVEVRSVSEQRTLTLQAREQIQLNGVDRTHQPACFHLGRDGDGYALSLLGKSGEPHAHVPVALSLTHRDVRRPVEVELETDDDGRVGLGALPGVTSVWVRRPPGSRGPEAAPGRWPLVRDRALLPERVHIAAGESLALPYLGTEEDRISLLERRGDGFVRDASTCCRVEAGTLRVRGLSPGEYSLWLARERAAVHIRVCAGPSASDDQGAAEPPSGWLAGPTQVLARTPRSGLHITAAEVGEDGLEVRLGGVTAATRVHVFANRFLPGFDAAARLAPIAAPVPGPVALAPASSHYLSGRRLGDEVRYVLERRQASAHPGLMLERPSLLLNPWAVRKTESGEEHARAGDQFGAGAAARPPRPAPAAPKPAPADGAGPGHTNVDFVAAPALTLLNLRPEVADDVARVRVPRAALGQAQVVRVVATDGRGLVCRELGLPACAGQYRDLRLRAGLDPNTPVAQVRRVQALVAGESLLPNEPAKTAGARRELYDTLGKVFELFVTLSGDATLNKFRFLVEWPSLSDAQRRDRYSEYACHELHLWLARKDPDFFAAVVAPYLRNKHHKTFLDHYLLEADLSEYLRPWAYGRLNPLERILLAQRVERERGPGRRHIEDLCELLEADPERPERDEHLFRVAIARGALDGGPEGGGEPPEPEPEPGPLGSPQVLAMASRKRARKPAARMAKLEAPPMPQAAEAPVLFAAAAPASVVDLEEAELMEAAELDSLYAAEEVLKKRDVADRSQVRSMYRPADRTEEWAENNYYRRRASEQGPELIPMNRFWRDFARHDGAGPFVSPHLAEACSNLTEALCALAVLDLPFAAAPHHRREGEGGQTLELGSPAVGFCEYIVPIAHAVSAEAAPLQLRQHYLRHDDRVRHDGGLELAKHVSGPLEVGVVYACEVVLTNLTAAPLDLDLLLQIPRGAVPVGDGFVTRGQRLRLGAYLTVTREYCFYFPAPGRFEHFPAHVSRGDELLAVAPTRPIEVVAEAPALDAGSWGQVSQHGPDEEVLRYLARENVERIDLDKLAWRMGERALYEAVIAALEARHVYHRTLWSYALVHRDRARVATLLAHEDGFLRQCGPALRCPLLDIDPVRRGWYEHLEYAPLIHARAHALGGKRRITNQALAEQYRGFLDGLAAVPALADDDRLAAAYYLLLQDRVDEGLAMFDAVDGEAVSARLQYDYLAAVAALVRGDPARARAYGEAHADHPVRRWRKRFGAVLSMLDEVAGAPPPAPGAEGAGESGADAASAPDADEGERLAAHRHLAETQPGFDLTVEAGEVIVHYQNLDQVELRYYLMDIELAFSREPFVSQAAARVRLVKPHRSERVTLPAGRDELRVPIPAEYRRRNLVVEVAGAGLRKAQVSYAHALLVRLAAPYGEVRVSSQAERAPVPGCYVKVYARLRGGEVRFYKDGYTDLRGCFDYAALSTDTLERVERFALLVMSAEHGAVVREVAPPTR
ncbi:hypothetical protein [Haliangium sp.]|uniref:hypothetical protein n=1 Tax=Haliangium sp. TaxID=2663208 RepID=UPI003D130DF8